MPKLQVGDIIEVFGWVMLEKLDAGVYRVKAISKYYDKETYSFARVRGHKTLCRHYTDGVDCWIKTTDDPDLNKIVKKQLA